MHIGGNAADRDKDDENKHNDIKEDTEGFVFDVFFEGEHGHEKDGSGRHGVRRREAWLARAVWASVQNEDVIENEVGCSYEH